MSMKTIVSAGCVAAVMALGGPASAQTRLSFGYGHPETAIWTTHFVRPWLNAASARIEGGLNYEIFAGGSVITLGAALEGLSSGVVDASQVSTQFWRGQLPANILLVDIGGTFGDRMAATAAMAEMVMHNCPACAAEDEQWNIVPIVVDSSGPYQLLCNRQINSPQEMSGLRIRATGLAGRVVEEMGAVPANVTFAELYESLQRGVLDCAAGEPSWLTTYSFRDVVSNVIEVSATKNVIPHVISFNREYWDELSEETQAILIEEAQLAYVDRVWEEQGQFDDSREELSQTITFTPAPDWMQEAVDRANERIRAEAIQIAQAAGVSNAQEIADTFLAIYRRWEAELGGRDVSREEMQQVLVGIASTYRP